MIDISFMTAIGCMQMAMFVAPLLVLTSFSLGRPMLFYMTTFEVVAVITGILIAILVFQDGGTCWLEGALLLFSITYSIMHFISSTFQPRLDHYEQIVKPSRRYYPAVDSIFRDGLSESF
jgi:Ca2+:H+ antiporter